MMGLEGAAKGVLIMQCSMPVAVFAYLFAMRYDRQPQEVAATVVISTVMSFLLLPALLWYVLP
jgi:predicted permease